ncbi:MAG: sulfite exporter TauE/SafE family protein [Nitrospirota bacterium]|nr:sulfite exporter TauE/SafE family protein [Nitrospirota bacterium]
MTFSVSGVSTNVLLPPLISLVISYFTSMGGISGAFLLLPFQMSILNYTAPSVSGTNHVFNIIAIPSGVYRYIKERRMAWPLTWVVIAGTLPGVFIGYYLRVLYLPDPKTFKLFAGCVLLYIGLRLMKDLLSGNTAQSSGAQALEEKFKTRVAERRRAQGSKMAAGIPTDAVVRTISVSLKKVEYEFWGERFSFNTLGMFGLACIVGIIGGAYGIGGGAIIAPFCVAFFQLPVYTIAGATLMGTFITSIAGALFFTLLPPAQGVSPLPDWPLGILFGIGGFAGMYLGAKSQKYLPQNLIKIIVGSAILFLAIKYIVQYF